MLLMQNLHIQINLSVHLQLIHDQLNNQSWSRILENDNEEIVNTKVKDLSDGIGKYVEFTVVETDKKGGKYRIINCFPSKDPQDSIIKTVKTNYKLSN